MLQLFRRCRHRYTAVATLTARWRYGTRSRAVAMSKSRPDVSKMTHGFFITINSMILYFKHIIHIHDFPLNGHPPSSTLNMSSTTSKLISIKVKRHAEFLGLTPGLVWVDLVQKPDSTSQHWRLNRALLRRERTMNLLCH